MFKILKHKKSTICFAISSNLNCVCLWLLEHKSTQLAHSTLINFPFFYLFLFVFLFVILI